MRVRDLGLGLELGLGLASYEGVWDPWSHGGHERYT